MKKLLLFAITIIFSSSVFAQKDTIGLNIPIKDGSIVYSEVVQVDGKTKTELYKNSKQWFVDAFKNSNNVIQNEDQASGIIIGKGLMPFRSHVNMGMKWTWYDKMTVKIESKDNRYRYTIYDMQLNAENNNDEYPLEQILAKLTGGGKFPWGKGVAKDVIKDNDKSLKEMIDSIKKQMAKQVNDF